LADRLERFQQERTRPEGPPSSSTSYGTTSIDALDKGVRGGPDPAALSPETYPKVVDNS